MIEAGQKAPSFSLKDHAGNTVKLADFKGQSVVLYFYPKDNTPGCTVEACNFRDEHSALRKQGAMVLGVSPDDAKSHQKFIDKFSLPFPLLVDADHAVAEAYGAWGEKSLYGRKFMGIIRSTFLIGPDGKVKAAWPKVKVEGHVDEVLAALTGEAPAAEKKAKKPVAPKAKKKAPARTSAR
ncbi:MAG: thioredoxin-dependent thiol peroxidase [Archangium sp.]|nr:thioredoxin-dependent thiol peroxidase [Archangium sp.]